MSSSETTSEHSTASVSDVRGVIATDLEDSEIISTLEDAWFDNQRVNDLAAMDDPLIEQIEKHLAAYKIRATRDRDLEKGKRKSVSMTYDGSALNELRRKVRDLDPSGELISQAGVTRRTGSHVSSARPHSKDGIGDRDVRDSGTR